MQEIFKFNLRDKVKDNITSYIGIITARTQFLNGCIRYGVQTQTLKTDGSILEEQYFDEQQLELVAKDPVKKETKKKPGGPGPITPKYGHKTN